jgi:hypothetical protein
VRVLGQALLGGIAALLGGCGELGERQRFAAEVGSLTIVETVPAPGAAEVDPLARLDVCLSAEVDPRALGGSVALLRSADLLFDTQREVQLFAWRAPGIRSELASERWCPGSVLSLTPIAPLRPGLTYRLELRPALLGWAGEALDTEQAGWIPNDAGDLRRFVEFKVAGTPLDDPPEEIPTLPPGPTLTALFEPGAIFDPARAACGCHQRPDELASARLDLSDPPTAWTALVLRTGLEPTGFAMVTPRRPSESYLVHKLLRTDEGDGLHGLHGDAMPPDAPLAHADLVQLAWWIADGARL